MSDANEVRAAAFHRLADDVLGAPTPGPGASVQLRQAVSHSKAMRGVSWLLVVVACDAPPKPAPAPAPPPPAPATPVANVTTSVELQWSNVVQTDGCFFFSGPDGRDDRLQGTATLERNGTSIRLRVGSAEFDGTYRGSELTLVRVSPHEFGDSWLALETINGTYTERVMRAKYRYRECQAGGPCPGRCEIGADLVFVR